MNKPYLNATVSADRNFAHLHVEGLHTQSELVRANAPTLEGLIRTLAAQRAQMHLTPPANPDETQILLGAVDPVFRVKHGQIGEPLVLDIRHPGVGWIRFLFHQTQADALIADLRNPTQ